MNYKITTVKDKDDIPQNDLIKDFIIVNKNIKMEKKKELCEISKTDKFQNNLDYKNKEENMKQKESEE